MNNNQCLITNIQRYSLNDGPGMRTTVFLKGCRLKCPWCHNPETQSFRPDIYFKSEKCHQCGSCAKVCPQDAIMFSQAKERIDRSKCNLCMECVKACPNGALESIGKNADEDLIFREVVSDSVFYQNSGGGVTFSGGEPLEHPQFLLRMLKRMKGANINTCIDTTGYADWEIIQNLLPYLDLVLYDIKTMDDELHQKATGVSNKLILENFAKLVSSDIQVRVRIPLIPEFNFSINQIEKIADFIQNYSVQAVDILPYHRFASIKYRMLNKQYKLKGKSDLTKEDAQPYANIFKLRGLAVTIGG